MKNLLFLLIPLFVFSQQRDPRSDQFNFVPGELIVKLKDDVDAGVVYASVGQAPAAGKLVVKNSISKEVSRIIGLEAAVKSQEVLFSKESVDNSIRLKQQKTLQRVQQQRQLQSNSSGGSTPPSATKDEPEEVLSLKNVVKLELEDKNANILELVEKLKDNPNIEYIEPNYIYSINDFEIASDIIYDKDLSQVSTTSTTVPDDPLYSQQTNITQTNIDDVWNEYTTGDGSQIVAILDTGVDYTHPDLEANIWINEAELNGVEGYDDDGNGYVDDIRGWDFINNDNAPLDDNMHGTHVAGIVGAVGGNGIGVAGAAWNIKLMPIKVFQASGLGNVAQISEGIAYAVINKANVINMSFASISNSTTLYNALTVVNEKTILVASSGNDQINLGPCPGCRPYFPAAYRFVIGVEDSSSGYDNYDGDGSVFSGYSDLLNYECKAPGTKILSTIPNGGYRELTGSSMSTPLVSGAISLLLNYNNNLSREFILGDISNASDSEAIDFLKVFSPNRKPLISISSTLIDDSYDVNNRINDIVDAGDVVKISSLIKNWWSETNKIHLTLEFGGNEFQNEYFSNHVVITDNSASTEPIGFYSSRWTEEDYFIISLSQDIIHGTQIILKITATDISDNTINAEKLIMIDVKNKKNFSGVITENTVLEKGEYYIDKNLIVSDCDLTLNPGVQFILKGGVDIIETGNGRIIGNGNKDDFIVFRRDPTENGWFNEMSIELTTCEFCDFSIFDDTYLEIKGNPIIKHSILAYSSTWDQPATIMNSFIRGTYYKNTPENESNLIYIGGVRSYSEGIDSRNNYASGSIYGLSSTSPDSYPSIYSRKNGSNSTLNIDDIFIPILGNKQLLDDLVIEDLMDTSYSTSSNYSSDMDILNTDNIPQIPYEASPGFVYDLKINSKRARYVIGGYDHESMPVSNGERSLKQVEYDNNLFFTEPLGVGVYDLDVYFNKKMNITEKPTIHYGNNEPFNQVRINTSNGNWDDEGKIFSCQLVIGVNSFDGINRFRISEARDTNNFIIPINKQFMFDIQSVGSVSTGFMATAGLGEITLDWTAPSESDLNDVLGYNMYRYTANDDGTFTEPVKINESLITDITFKDYDVVRDTQYFYKYKILRTSFEETDYSNAVSSQLLTAALGDSNGDSSVNVMDVVNTVDYILGNNPTPFVDYATDVNNDSSVNVLDVVGIVDMILNPAVSSVRLNGEPINYISNAPVGEAELFWRDNDLYVKTDKPISGLQLSFDGDLSFTASELLEGYELNNFMIDDKRVVMAYSFDGFQITPGTHKLLSTSNEPLDVTAGAMATSYGESIFVLYNQGAISHIDAPLQTDKLEVLSVSPNPSNGLIKIHYYLPEQMDNLSFGVFDLSGRLMWNSISFKNTKGHARASLDLQELSTGTYIMMINANRSGETKFNHTAKIVIE
ncbi:MAG: S8 family serine peptidase [Flavobacteriaceae bacterium]|nr:S8 family serine peptidase [Flavobacteriaceae bacterium]